MTTSANHTLNLEPGTLNPRYAPSGDELLIYEFVKMQGKTQSSVAGMFGINQSTVSRIIQRIERWQAHAKARENGRLDPRERFSAQSWLTYERNELILASCLRIAHEMEGFTELSKSTICRPIDSPSHKHQIRTEGRTIDRHGVAARFLRLAWRINMDQLKLTEQLAIDDDISSRHTPCAVPDPLTAEELAAEFHQATLDAAELAAARHAADDSVGNAMGGVPQPGSGSDVGRAVPAEAQPGSGVFGEEGPSNSDGDPPPETPDPLQHEPTDLPGSTLNLELETLNSKSDHSLTHQAPPATQPTHNPHTECDHASWPDDLIEPPDNHEANRPSDHAVA